MKNQLLCTLWAIALITACNTPQPPAPDVKTDEAAVRQADLDWSKAAEAARWDDSTGYYAFLLDDAIFMGPNEPMWKGKATIREKLTPFFSMPGFSAKWAPDQSGVSGDLGYTIGNYDMLMTDSTGATSVLEHGKYLVVWKRQADGKWKVAAESFSADAPAEEPGR